MRGVGLIEELRERVGLARGAQPSKRDVETLIGVVPGLSLEEADLQRPYIYLWADGRGTIRAPRGWSRRVTDHDALLEEILHFCLCGYADGSATLRGEKRGHSREESRCSDHALLWHFAHAHAANLNDEDLAADTGRSLGDVSRFRQLQLRG